MACLVPNCSGGKHLLRHSLPKNNKLRRDWLLALNREDLIGKQFREVYTLKVCRKHFLPTSYRTSEGVCLNTNAMPIPVPKQTEIQSNTDKMLRTPNTKKRSCVARGCGAFVRKVHRLPNRKEIRSLWLKNLGREDLLDLPITTLKHRNVCEAHFKPSDFTYPGSGRLIRLAVPIPVDPEPVKFEDKIEDQIQIEDEIIATGEVTAPLLCDNKMLLKTKSTYCKNKYEMTFKDNTPLPSITDTLTINDENFDADDFSFDPNPTEINDNKNIDNNVNINNNNKKRKYSETFLEEDITKIEENDKYDDKLLSFLQEIGSLPKFLDVIFGFLYRRTDYYEITNETNIGVGLPEGLAQKLLWQAFKKYETPSVEEPPEMKLPLISEKPEVHTSVKIVENITMPTVKDKSDVRLFETYNGAVFENYAWSQTVTDVDVQIKIPDKITCKQMQIDIADSDMLIKQRNTDIVYLKGELCKKCKVNETVWSLGGHILQIHLEKDLESWWDCLLKAEPRLDFNKMNCPKISNLEEIVVKEETYNN